jgi:hypothetical protein
MWIKFGTGCVHKKLSDQEFRKNRRCESHTVFKGLNAFVFLLPTFIIRFEWKYVQELSAWKAVIFLVDVSKITFTCVR